jgi:hypothetical protein
MDPPYVAPGRRKGSSSIAVADLEKHAIKRDRRFLVRLVLLLSIGTLAGLLLFVKLTSAEVGTCAAGTFGAATDEEPSQP